MTAARTIQEAVDAGWVPGRFVLVADGVYDQGGVAIYGSLTNRIALTNAVVVRSVNGPTVTVIAGAPAPGGGAGPGAIRCAYVGPGAGLSGFTLLGGHTLSAGNFSLERNGGGVWMAPSGITSNCVLRGNSAFNYGGGACGGTLSHCWLADNSARSGGGGAYDGTLDHCLLTGNSGGLGGGAHSATLRHCTLARNTAENAGGGTCSGTAINCIVYDNTAAANANFEWTSFDYSCTTPLASGTGNITNEPGFRNAVAGDYRLVLRSPCIDTGTNISGAIPVGLDGLPCPLDGDGDGLAAFDMGAYEFDLRTVVPTNWFTQYGLDPADPHVVSQNPDHDPFTTFQEWLADTDPTNELSYFCIAAISNGPPMTVFFPSSSNRIYTLLNATNLVGVEWIEVPGQTAIRGSGGWDALADTNAAPAKYYRLGVTP